MTESWKRYTKYTENQRYDPGVLYHFCEQTKALSLFQKFLGGLNHRPTLEFTSMLHDLLLHNVVSVERVLNLGKNVVFL